MLTEGKLKGGNGYVKSNSDRKKPSAPPPPMKKNINEVMQGAEESAIRREKLCKVPPRCPICLTDQVQLIDWFSDVAEWKCRKNACRQVFKFELIEE